MYSSPKNADWIHVGQRGTGDLYLFFVSSLLADQQVKNGSVLLVELLHLVDVARDFVHGLHRDCIKTSKTAVTFSYAAENAPNFMSETRMRVAEQRRSPPEVPSRW